MGGQQVKHVNPNCYACHGSRFNATQGQPCRLCVCYKCNGSGWNQSKNKPCKKMKLPSGGMSGGMNYGGHGGKHGKHKKFKKFKKFKFKKLF